MPYDQQIEHLIDSQTFDWPGLTKKKMFGGICYLSGGNMCFGIYKEFVIVRLGDAAKAEAMMDGERLRPFDITGRPMKGWVMLSPNAYADVKDLAKWLDQGKAFAVSLSPK